MNYVLKFFYERIWVPLFGRILMLFASFIEGEDPKDKEKQTFDLREKDNK